MLPCSSLPMLDGASVSPSRSTPMLDHRETVVCTSSPPSSLSWIRLLSLVFTDLILALFALLHPRALRSCAGAARRRCLNGLGDSLEDGGAEAPGLALILLLKSPSNPLGLLDSIAWDSSCPSHCLSCCRMLPQVTSSAEKAIFLIAGDATGWFCQGMGINLQ